MSSETIPMKSRAAICAGPGLPLEIDIVDVRDPRADEVLIEIRASGLCHSDWHQISGSMPTFPYPVIPGHEGAGVVLEIGSGVTSVKPGDHVIPVSVPECRQCPNCLSGKTNLCVEFFANFASTGSPFSRGGAALHQFAGASTFANFTVVKEIAVVKIRKDAPFDTVCYAGCGVATGIGAVIKTARVGAGASVIVFGLGGIGLNVLQGARYAGARTIIGVDTNSAREELARRLGATAFVNPTAIGRGLVEHLTALTDGGADFTFECVGNARLITQAIEAARPGWGISIAIGAAPVGEDVRIPSMTMLAGRTWKGCMLGDIRARTDLPGIVDLYMENRIEIDALITHRLPFEKINEGFELMTSGEAVRTVITF
jgi:S-(hydroxymethyl)glutathione dehydrogenase / alcohol dehydrogenase